MTFSSGPRNPVKALHYHWLRGPWNRETRRLNRAVGLMGHMEQQALFSVCRFRLLLHSLLGGSEWNVKPALSRGGREQRAGGRLTERSASLRGCIGLPRAEWFSTVSSNLTSLRSGLSGLSHLSVSGLRTCRSSWEPGGQAAHIPGRGREPPLQGQLSGQPAATCSRRPPSTRRRRRKGERLAPG